MTKRFSVFLSIGGVLLLLAVSLLLLFPSVAFADEVAPTADIPRSVDVKQDGNTLTFSHWALPNYSVASYATGTSSPSYLNLLTYLSASITSGQGGYGYYSFGFTKGVSSTYHYSGRATTYTLDTDYSDCGLKAVSNLNSMDGIFSSRLSYDYNFADVSYVNLLYGKSYVLNQHGNGVNPNRNFRAVLYVSANLGAVNHAITHFETVYSSIAEVTPDGYAIFSGYNIGLSIIDFPNLTDTSSLVAVPVKTVFYGVDGAPLIILYYNCLANGYTGGYRSSSSLAGQVRYAYSSVGDVTLYDQGYRIGYELGKADGKAEQAPDSYMQGYDAGDFAGYNRGFSAGVASANDYSFMGLMSSVLSAPVKAVGGLLNFEVFGVDMSVFVFTLLTACLIIKIISWVNGGA